MREEIATILMAMIPVGEVRASIPVAMAVYGLSWQSALFFSFIGSITIALFLLKSLGFFSSIFSKHSPFFKRVFTWASNRAVKNHEQKLKKYGKPALILFVAIPLPVTGVWTASLLSFLFRVPFKDAFPMIAIGAFIASSVVTIFTVFGVALHSFFGWQILAGVAILTSLLYVFRRLSYKKRGVFEKAKNLNL